MIKKIRHLLRKDFIRTTILGLILNTSHVGFGFLISLLLANLLGADGYGRYSFALALILFASIPSQLGIPTLATRETAILNDAKNWQLLKGLWQRSHQFIMAISATIMVGFLGYYYFFYYSNGLSNLTILVSIILVPILSYNALRAGILRGLNKVVHSLFADQFIQPFVFFVLLLIAYFFIEGEIQSHIAMLGYVVASFIAFLVGLAFYYKFKPRELKGQKAIYKTVSWIKSSLPIGLISGLQTITNQVDILLIGVFLSDANVGVYRVALQLSALILFVLKVVNKIQGPKVAEMHANGKKEKLELYIKKTIRISAILTLPLLLILVLGGEFILVEGFGNEFGVAYQVLLILCIGKLASVFAGPVILLLNMTGNERITAQTVAFTSIANLILNLILIPLYGITGAAIATTFTTVMWNVLLAYRIKNALKINSTIF